MYDELVKRLREEAREADTFELMNNLFDADDAIEKLVLELGKASNSGGKTSWISVNERLPEKAGAYLVKEEVDNA